MKLDASLSYTVLFEGEKAPPRRAADYADAKLRRVPSTGSALPFTASGGSFSARPGSASAANVAALKSSGRFTSFVSDSTREAMFTVSPIAVYSMRWRRTDAPDTATPV